MKRTDRYRLLICLAALPFLTSCGGQTGDKEQAPKGNTIIETGTLRAVNTTSFILQRYSMFLYEMRIVGLLPHGTVVNEGDSVIQLDPADVNKAILQKETELEAQTATLEKLVTNQANAINNLESSIRTQTASFELKKIEMEAVRYESERTQQIRRLEFKQEEINLAKEKRRLELLRITNAIDLKVQQIRVRQIRNEIEELKQIFPKLTIRTPVSGVFQVGQSWRTGRMLKVGDSAYPRQSMGNVPELKHMKVETFINETDFLKIAPGQQVTVRLDALPKVAFEGEVTYVGKLCRLRDENSTTRQKGFDVEVAVKESDERLKPGMTVSCEFLTGN